MDRIMVVDDDRRMRRKLERLLIDSGYRVIKAESGEMLLEAIGRTPLDLIIMEAHLPGHTGLETLAKLREDNHRLPVIILAKTAATGDVIKAATLGAFDYALKPFVDGEMLKMIGLALETGCFMRTPVSLDQEPVEASGDNLVGRSKPMQEIYKAIGRVAPTDQPY